MIKRRIRSNNIKDKKKLAIVIRRIKRRRDPMNRMVSTDTLFQTKLNYKELNDQQKNEYIDKLTDEFLENANDLMLSLKDK